MTPEDRGSGKGCVAEAKLVCLGLHHAELRHVTGGEGDVLVGLILTVVTAALTIICPTCRASGGEECMC